MSKFTVKDLARGIKLTVSHMFDLPQHIATTLNSAANLIQQDQLQTGRAPFRLNFNVPVIDGHFVDRSAVASTGPLDYDYCIPFCLPPLQEFFDSNGRTSETTPQVVLDEVQLSFDQRGEAAAIADGLYNDGGGTGHQGKIDYDGIAATALEVAIMEKRQQVFDVAVAGTVPTREVFSAKLPETAFSGRGLRLNPWVAPDLNRPVNPYRTYLLMIRVNALDLELAGAITRNSHALCSLNVCLRFKHPLVHADVISGGADVQNIPSDHDGEPSVSASTLSLTVPAGNDNLRADGAPGLQTNYKSIDELYANRFRGGFTKDSDRPGYNHLDHDCGYSVIAVPMFANIGNERLINGSVAQVNKMPYTAAASANPGADRRIITLDYPFTVHHVVACWNYMNPAAGLMPTRAGFTTKIGVGLLTGLRADEYDYQQVAYVTFTPATKATWRIDRVKAKLNSILNADVADFELFHVPLVVQGGNNGTGYTAQGRPFWCGKSTSRLAARRNVGAVGGGNDTQDTKGVEQLIEVRWTMEEFGGLDQAADDETFVGYGGHWVLLFGKVGLMADGDIRV